MNTKPTTSALTETTKGLQLSDPLKKEIDHWLSKYPANQRQSAIIPALLIGQRYHQGWLPTHLIDVIADYIDMPRTAAYEVATFYSMLELKPVGCHKISVCTNISCMLNGSEHIVNHLKKKLNIQLGETTADKQFTLKEVECLGACIQAPVLLINDQYHQNITTEGVDKLLATLDKKTLNSSDTKK